MSDADEALIASLPRVGRASGKAILVGEHFVVHGAPALAVPVPIDVALKLEKAYSGTTPLREGSAVGLAGLELMIRELGLGSVFSRIAISLEGALPLGAGLGGSAALAAALLRALSWASRGDGGTALAAKIHRLERLAHGNPSGLDGMTVALQRPIWLPDRAANRPEHSELIERFGRAGMAEVFDASERWVSVHNLMDCDGFGDGGPRFALPLTVAIVPRHGTTKEAVARVAAWKDHHPARFAELLAATGVLAEAARAAMAHENWPALGAVFDAAHAPLAELGLVSPEQETLVETLRAAGAYGAKMSGAGLGGAVIALGPDGLDFEPVLRQAGAVQVFTSTFGQGIASEVTGPAVLP